MIPDKIEVFLREIACRSEEGDLETCARKAKKLICERGICADDLLRFEKRSFCEDLWFAYAIALTGLAMELCVGDYDKWEACRLADLWADKAGRRGDVRKYYEDNKDKPGPLINNYYANLLADLCCYEEAEEQYLEMISKNLIDGTIYIL